MLQLNAFLKEKMVKEIKTTKIGLAICPIFVDAQEKLGTRIREIEASLFSSG